MSRTDKEVSEKGPALCKLSGHFFRCENVGELQSELISVTDSSGVHQALGPPVSP